VSLKWLPILYCGKKEEASSLLVCVVSNKREKQRERKRLEAERSQFVPR
jgi:hypothetical protein